MKRFSVTLAVLTVIASIISSILVNKVSELWKVETYKDKEMVWGIFAATIVVCIFLAIVSYYPENIGGFLGKIKRSFNMWWFVVLSSLVTLIALILNNSSVLLFSIATIFITAVVLALDRKRYPRVIQQPRKPLRPPFDRGSSKR